MRYFYPLIAVILAGCASSETPRPNNIVFTESKENLRFDNSLLKRQVFDMNHDGNIDLWKYYVLIASPKKDGQTENLLTRKELDLNFDGTIDRIMYYNQKENLIHEEIDSDFNGTVDRIYFYDNALVIKTEIYTPQCPQIIIDSPDNPEHVYPSMIRHYNKGILTREESDEKCDGIRENIAIFDGKGNISQVGHDTNGDGIIEEWIRY